MLHFYSGLISLCFGLLYYAVFRYWPVASLTDFSQGCFPSFAFVLAATLIGRSYASGGWVSQYRSGLIWLCLVLALEPVLGTFDPLDVMAALAGFVVAMSLPKSQPFQAHFGRPLAPALMGVTGIALLAGCYMGPYYDNNGPKPVYLSYSDLRSSVRVEPARTMESMGSLYLYGDYLFINEKNAGLHVVNNVNPETPVAEAFIKIPGNTSVTIRNGYLYADSFIDLVVLDVRDISNVQEVSRQMDIFNYDAYQVVDNSVYLYNVDQDKGVVIGYE